jgi:DNA recombination protein RmuC
MSEVWQVLRAVKSDFGKFGGLLEKAKDQLAKVQDSLDWPQPRRGKIENRLNKAEQLAPADLAAAPALTAVPPESESRAGRTGAVTADDRRPRSWSG